MSNKFAQLNLFNRKTTSNNHLINEKKRLIQLAVERYNNNKINYIHRIPINKPLEINNPEASNTEVSNKPLEINNTEVSNKPLEINNPEVSNKSLISNENIKKNKCNNDITKSKKNIAKFKDCVIFHKKTDFL
jgi:hypothetical protein